MMMLIVFTAFLGMELKTAVGTSTFIMTFTALIASTSHILIHPAIILEKWDVLIFCIVVATAASLASAKFANRVKNRTIGLVTGAVLTLLGASMLILNYWQTLSQIELFVKVLHCIGYMVAFIIPCLIVLLLIRAVLNPPSFVFRKLLHLAAFAGTSFMVMSSSCGIAVVLTSLLFAIILYPVITILEKESWFDKFFVQKKPGEIKLSMLLLLTMFAVLTAAAWYLRYKPYIAATSILMWGAGDGAAALVGIPFGKHKVKIKPADGKKSWEGSIAMLIVSFISGLLMLIFAGHMEITGAVAIALIASLAGTITELFTPSEFDTVTVPAVIEVLLLLFIL
jgi:dolichol kinase